MPIQIQKILLVALAITLATPTIAQAMFVDIPLPIVATRGDLIVIADVTDSEQAAQLELKFPGTPKATTAWAVKYKLNVTRVIRENGKMLAKTDAKAGKREISIFLIAPKPQLPGTPRLESHFTPLKVGQPYVLILQNMPDKPEYFLPAHPRNRCSVSDKNIARVEKAADITKWPWGKADSGLVTAMIPSVSSVQLRQKYSFVRGANGKFIRKPKEVIAYMPCLIALRNITKKPLSVSLYPNDKFLSITARNAKGKSVKVDLYQYLNNPALRIVPFGPQHIKTIAPGEMLFIQARGLASDGTVVKLKLPAGDWKFKVEYTCKRKGDKPLWNGTIKSTPVPLEVRAPTKR
ncbi:MAG: hypothetical protein GY794_26365 [bacterium]|nr:hypothetical protein [bacterium]